MLTSDLEPVDCFRCGERIDGLKVMLGLTFVCAECSGTGEVEWLELNAVQRASTKHPPTGNDCDDGNGDEI